MDVGDVQPHRMGKTSVVEEKILVQSDMRDEIHGLETSKSFFFRET
jgi:hypothetical protein